jgi:Flp pilus assembly pilin Flp
MQLLTGKLAALSRDRAGKITVEQGLIAALIGVVVVSIVTTLSGTLETPLPGAEPTAVGQEGP